jgi:CRISPR-associated protein Cmr6
MRKALEHLLTQPADHLGLSYEIYAKIDPATGKIPDQDRQGWLDNLCQSSKKLPEGYSDAYERWKTSFATAQEKPWAREGTLTSRMLVGHGLSSATDVGLTLHPTWGVPYIPGSALKGLLAHYIEHHYGPYDDDQGDDRQDWRGVTWDGKSIARGPGDLYKILFGAPDSIEEPRGASQGHIIFHDALLVPPPADTALLETDVLTVHQKDYYNAAHSDQPHVPAPCDYDDPNPVSFLTASPGLSFLFILSGPKDWADLAGALLSDALQDWGIGGKTSVGYGHITFSQDAIDYEAIERKANIQAASSSPIVEDIKAWFGQNQGLTAREKVRQFDERWSAEIDQQGNSALRGAIWDLIKENVPRDSRTKEWLNAWKAKLSP